MSILDIISSNLDDINNGRIGFEERSLVFEGDTYYATTICGIYNRLKQNGFLSTADGSWANIEPLWKQRYIPALETGDLQTLLHILRNFFRNELSAGIISHIAERKESGFEYEDVNGKIICDLVAVTRQCPDITLSQLEIPCVGNPYGLSIGHNLIVPDAPRHFSHAGKIASLISDIESPQLLEIGAGYGGVLYMLQSLMGDRPYKYIICDLECVLFIALYFLQTCKAILNWDKKISVICGLEDLENEEIGRADIILIPANLLYALLEWNFDLVYNANSFSEMTFDTLAGYFAFVNKVAPRHIFLQANLWGGPAFDHPTIRLSDFPISTDYRVAEWRYAPWISGAGKSKEVVFERKQ